jgi:nucleotide-binding universal stress UspA family protein
VSSALERGDPKETLLYEARYWKADAIFVGCRGQGRFARMLLGSVSAAIVDEAPCTVEVVRSR